MRRIVLARILAAVVAALVLGACASHLRAGSGSAPYQPPTDVRRIDPMPQVPLPVTTVPSYQPFAAVTAAPCVVMAGATGC
jgi:hypothetical protein